MILAGNNNQIHIQEWFGEKALNIIFRFDRAYQQVINPLGEIDKSFLFWSN